MRCTSGKHEEWIRKGPTYKTQRSSWIVVSSICKHQLLTVYQLEINTFFLLQTLAFHEVRARAQEPTYVSPATARMDGENSNCVRARRPVLFLVVVPFRAAMVRLTIVLMYLFVWRKRKWQKRAQVLMQRTTIPSPVHNLMPQNILINAFRMVRYTFLMLIDFGFVIN